MYNVPENILFSVINNVGTRCHLIQAWDVKGKDKLSMQARIRTDERLNGFKVGPLSTLCDRKALLLVTMNDFVHSRIGFLEFKIYTILLHFLIANKCLVGFWFWIKTFCSIYREWTIFQ